MEIIDFTLNGFKLGMYSFKWHDYAET